MPSTTTVSPPDLADLAAQTPADRNRAVDFYRAVAMGVVALGHWLGMVVVLDADGELMAGNALELVPSLWPATWIGQVMPLFFFVGGFASATSLRSARRKGVEPTDWVVHRLRRMMAPAALLALFWMSSLVIGTMVGQPGIVTVGAYGAAIPLWFLANYTIDIALAPYTYRWFQRAPGQMLAVLAGVFAVCEVANLAGVPLLPQVNWVLGWLLFQIAGFAWRDGRLPTGRRLVMLAGGLWSATIAAVALGPWPAEMLHHGGLEHSPTHPPSLAFLLFGLAYSTTAVAGAPGIDRWLQRSRRAWTATVAANTVAMTVYLWHMTAAVLVTAPLVLTDRVPQVDVGSAAWWATKPLLVLPAAAVLALIVRSVVQVERDALLAPQARWRGSVVGLLTTAVAISAGVKMWSSSSPMVLSAGLLVTLVVWFGVIRPSVASSAVDAGDHRPEMLGTRDDRGSKRSQ